MHILVFAWDVPGAAEGHFAGAGGAQLENRLQTRTLGAYPALGEVATAIATTTPAAPGAAAAAGPTRGIELVVGLEAL